MKFAISGSAGFIGAALSLELLKNGHEVIGIDNLNNYYDIELKKYRLSLLEKFSTFKNLQIDILNLNEKNHGLILSKVDYFIHLAGQAGVRHSINSPMDYIQANIVGFMNVLELCKNINIKNLIYASSSSVYGKNDKMPFSEDNVTNTPLSIYAATKQSNELMAYSYSHLNGIKTIGLRFFTVYGPMGRPDMAMKKFTDSIINSKEIYIFNGGNHTRDFTFIEDVTTAIKKIISNSNKLNNYEIFNIGNNKTTGIRRVIEILEAEIGKKAIIIEKEAQAGDMLHTQCDNSKFINHFGCYKETPIELGLHKYVKWYLSYYKNI